MESLKAVWSISARATNVASLKRTVSLNRPILLINCDLSSRKICAYKLLSEIHSHPTVYHFGLHLLSRKDLSPPKLQDQKVIVRFEKSLKFETLNLNRQVNNSKKNKSTKVTKAVYASVHSQIKLLSMATLNSLSAICRIPRTWNQDSDFDIVFNTTNNDCENQTEHSPFHFHCSTSTPSKHNIAEWKLKV